MLSFLSKTICILLTVVCMSVFEFLQDDICMLDTVCVCVCVCVFMHTLIMMKSLSSAALASTEALAQTRSTAIPARVAQASPAHTAIIS